MLRQGYAPRLAAGCIAAGGTLGVLIPPSGILVIYSIITDVSLVDLFVAAFVPGVLTAIAYVIGIIVWVKLRSEEHTSELQSLMRISYAVFCLQKKKYIT